MLFKKIKKLLESTENHLQIASSTDSTPEQLTHVFNVGDENIHHALANNPATPTKILSDLSAYGRDDIEQSVAANPNADIKDVARLAIKNGHIDHALSNPMLGLHFLEKPQIADNSVDVDPKHSMLHALGNFIDKDTLASHLQNTYSKDILQAFYKHPDPNVVSGVASNPYLHPNLLNNLASHQSEDVRAAVAENHKTPKDTLHNLLFDKEHSVAGNAIKNKETPMGSIIELAKKGDIEHLYPIVNKFSIKEDDKPAYRTLLNTLSNTDNSYLKKDIAKNDHVSPNTLSKLSKDKDINVRISVANNRNTPTQVLEKMDRSHRYIRASLVRNSNSSPELLREVYKHAAKDPNEVKNIVGSIINNDNTPGDVLHAALYYLDDVYDIRKVISNPNVLPRTLEKMAKHENPSIRTDVAENAKTPDSILQQLEQDPEPDVASTANYILWQRNRDRERNSL